jgi:large subunit ribosomal protein L21
MYAIVKTGGKQYRVEQGMSLVVERLRADEGAKVSLQALLFVDGSKVVEGGDGVNVEARVLAHERGPKLRVVKFKPKRGYKRRNGHRQELTRLEVTSIKGPAARARRSAAAKEEPAEKPAAEEPADKPATRGRHTPSAEAADKPAAKPAARRRAAPPDAAEEPAPKPATRRRSTPKKKETPSDGS